MGKKSKMINEDPILKKNFKLEKRKKDKQLEKLKANQELQDQENKMNQLKSIEKQIQSQIQSFQQIEKQKILAQNKSKIINKNSLFQAFKNRKNQFQKSQLAQSATTYQKNFIKNLSKYTLKVFANTYESHFAQKLPQNISQILIKQKKMTQETKIDRQIKNEINSMFSISKIGQQPQTKNLGKINKTNGSQMLLDPESKKLSEQLEREQHLLEPYILNKKNKTQTEATIQGKFVSISELALQYSVMPNISSQTQSQHQLLNQTQPQHQKQSKNKFIQIASEAITSYVDYIHIENKQQQTIEEFRRIIIKHMYDHYLNCFKALKQQKKSKGFTNTKFLVISPYIGDAKATFDLIQEQFMKDSQQFAIEKQNQKQLQKKKKLVPGWVIQNKQKIQQKDDEDDFFRVGIKILPKKKKLVYFSNFDTSDIIVASPIGLKAIIDGQQGKGQTSFLSSVEIVYIDRASIIMMQNWDHLFDIFQNLNYMPKYQSLKNSINEIREEFLELKGKVYRQNIVFTEFGFPQLNSLKINQFHNWQGSITNKPAFNPLILEKNSIIQKNFFKIELKQPKDDLERRFQYFKRKFWDKINNNDNMHKVVIFVNSYFEFVKLKGFLEKVNASFEAISEHTKKQKIQSRVSLFNNKNYRILLLTERAYYFGLCQIKKLQHIYFYSLPKNSFIYKDLIESMQQTDGQESKIVCIYSKYDKYIVERIVGSAKSIQMIREYCTNVSFIL